jgi:hypothetical protein
MAYEPLDSDLSPAERLKFKAKAYDKFLNLQPAAEEKQRLETSQMGKEALRNVYKGVRQGGYSGRQAASGALDQSQLEMEKLAAQQAAERDALAAEGAGMKEDIIGERQKAGLQGFKRQTEEMEYQLNKAIAERAWDMGMTAKELAFHTNAQVADIGLEKMKEDFDKGMIKKAELERLKANLELAANQAKQAAQNALNELKRQGQMAVDAYSREKMLELQNKLLDAQKDALIKQTKASNMAAILSGAFQVGGSYVGYKTGMGSGFGEAAGKIGGGLYSLSQQERN